MSGNYSATRRSVHAIAEQVLAGPEHRSTGEIALRVTADAVTTTAGPDIRLTATRLVCAAGQFPLDGTSCAALAAAAGVEVGPPIGLYVDVTGVDPDELLTVEAGAASLLLAALWRGAEALLRLAPEHPPVLWPEHFDVGISLGEVNYGVSPGDSYLDEPYAYVGPWQPRVGEFWNAPFGAAVPLRELPGSRLDEFLARGRRLTEAGNAG